MLNNPRKLQNWVFIGNFSILILNMWCQILLWEIMWMNILFKKILRLKYVIYHILTN
jgi:hypothetical protein